MEPIELIATCSRCKKSLSQRFPAWLAFYAEGKWEGDARLCDDCATALEALKEHLKKEREEKLAEFFAGRIFIGGPAE